MAASVALWVTRTKLPVSLSKEENEAQQKTEKDPLTFCMTGFLLASISRFSSFPHLDASWKHKPPYPGSLIGVNTLEPLGE